MKVANVKKSLASLALIASTAALVGCGGGGGGGSTWGAYQSPLVSAQSFVNGLNAADGAPSYDLSEIELYSDETIRSAVAGQDDWFVIYDAKFNEHKAVSLQYIRSIIYYDYYANNTALAEEFRDIETSDILAGNTNGDFWGDDYEVVDYNIFSGVYVGRNSGFSYEDEQESTDVNLLAQEKEQKQFFKKAASISYAFNVSIETAMSLATLGNTVERMVKKGDLTQNDQKALVGKLEHLTGKSLEEVVAAGSNEQAKKELLSDIASRIGTTAESLEGKIMPQLLGITLEKSPLE
jgi:polyhydroxyalkanoate synthesis regulator phasin